MQDKLLLEVKLPATGAWYEFRVPLDLTVEQSARLVSQIVARCESARYEASDDVDLMYCDAPYAGQQLNPNELVRVLVGKGALVDGSHVALV
ncbi:hypothetical protein [Olsenella profusa]|uniref:Uncharacterized protein n=1 Tax=Olsenella profusa F0195 TaxID=1125712 RepID=U2T9X0_9ACTN|nr:hypothetical protein [Olsenella profusa]ERL09819.1 hypothetical protein HMPREF1316_1574 [Olsenella profusa F0195]